VTQYAIVYQMFSLGPVLFGMFLNALWPAYGEAKVRGDSEWIRATFRRCINIGLYINVPYALLLVTFGNAAAHLWVGPQIRVSSLVLLAFGIWTMMNSLNGPVAVFLNGANAIRFQAICGSLMACLNLLLSIGLTRIVACPASSGFHHRSGPCRIDSQRHLYLAVHAAFHLIAAQAWSLSARSAAIAACLYSRRIASTRAKCRAEPAAAWRRGPVKISPMIPVSAVGFWPEGKNGHR